MSEEQEVEYNAIRGPGAERRKAKYLTAAKKIWIEEINRENAVISAQNSNSKTQREEEMKFILQYPNIAVHILGVVLACCSKEIEKTIKDWKKPLTEAEIAAGVLASNYDEALARHDWLWVFEAARAAVFNLGAAGNPVAMMDSKDTSLQALMTVNIRGVPMIPG